MFIRRTEYERRLKEARDASLLATRVSMEEFGATVEKIAQQAVNRAETRALAAERTLTEERKQHSQELRHFASMFLRREKSYPLPPTKEEKAEAQAEAEEQRKQPIPLTDIEISMRDANRREAARCGISEEQADRDFQSKILGQMTE